MHSSLAALAGYCQFVVYKSVPSETRPGKTDKIPCDYRTGKIASAHNPDNWIDSSTAEKVASEWGAGWGYGFVFTTLDPFWFLDLDGHLNPATGQWSELAMSLFQMFPGCAAEISASGTGGHIFGTGIPPAHSCKNVPLGLEFYHEGRFAALTGTGAIGNVATDASAMLPWLVANYFPPGAEADKDQTWTDAPVAHWRGPVDDADLLRRAMQSRSLAGAFSGKASFADLWLGDERALASTYPPQKQEAYDASSADMALAQHLAFWTGRNCERIERLMWQSKLVRPKWEERADYYLPRTILRACARSEDVCEDASPLEAPPAPVGLLSDASPSVAIGAVPPPPASPPVSQGGLVQRGSTTGIMSREFQPQHFAGAVYVSSLHRAFVPGGDLLKPEQFKVRFGGYKFIIDHTNEKTTRDAWEAWTQNEVYRCPQVFGTCFRPDLETGEVVTRNGQSFVNTYVPVEIKRTAGNPQPFLAHLAKVLPDDNDRAIVLAYMAACVQFQGVKFQWAPLLQGVEGNGKTLFARCVAEAIGRRYVHFPPASEISEKFNSWLFDTIFIGVEDIYVPNQKQEVFEILKPMITSDYLAKRAMQTDQVMREVIANFFFNSNHKDGLKKTKNDRRICVMFCAQQQNEDLTRDGMNGDYFSKLYDWLKKSDGYAIVSEYLHTYPIPDALNPAKDCQRAPLTSSTQEAIRVSAGTVEQEIEEAVAQGLQGFRGGWISSIWLDRLLERLGLLRRVGHHKRREMLEAMGYILHPALRDGRVNNAVLPEQGKPRLFVRKESLLIQLTTPAEVAKEYERSNRQAEASQLPFGNAAHR